MEELTIEQIMALPRAQRIKYLQSLSKGSRDAIVEKLPTLSSEVEGGDDGIGDLSEIISSIGGGSSDGVAEASSISPVSDILNTLKKGKKIKDGINSAGNVAGAVLNQNIIQNPESATLGDGALSGALSGMGAGPIGIVGGALIGALNAGNRREEFETEEQRRQEAILDGLRVQPGTMEDGGSVIEDIDPSVLIPKIEEKGEMMLFPDGKIVDSMATKSHKDNDSKDPTDFLPNGTFVFSNSKKKEIDLSKIKDDILEFTTGRYSEDGNTPMKKVTMGDVYGKKGKKTPAEIIKKIRKRTPMVENPKEKFEIQTNIDNLRNRLKLIRPIMEMQEGVYKKFEFDDIEEMELGGIASTVDGCPDGYHRNEEGECVNSFGEISIVEDINAAKRVPAVKPVSRLPIGVPVVSPSQPVNPGKVTTEHNVFKEDAFDKYVDYLDDRKDEVDENHQKALAKANKNYKLNRLNNFGQLMSSMAGTVMQDFSETPHLLEVDDVDKEFPLIQESEIQRSVTNVKKNVARALEQINNSGISGSKVGAAIGGISSRVMDAESGIRGNAMKFNKTQEAQRYRKLNAVINQNGSSVVAAKNAERTNRNQATRDLADSVTNFLSSQGKLRMSKEERIDLLNKWKDEETNKATLKQIDLAIKEETNDKVISNIKSILENQVKNFKSSQGIK